MCLERTGTLGLKISYRKATGKLQESYGDAVESCEKAKIKLKKRPKKATRKLAEKLQPEGRKSTTDLGTHSDPRRPLQKPARPKTHFWNSFYLALGLAFI